MFGFGLPFSYTKLNNLTLCYYGEKRGKIGYDPMKLISYNDVVAISR